MIKKLNYKIRNATLADLSSIVTFVDYWLRNGAKSKGVVGGVNDYFIPRGRHHDYLTKYHVFLAIHRNEIIGWLVINQSKTLLHLLIAADCRGHYVGSSMIRFATPEVIRSKTDQSTGNPKKFYQKCGYKRIHVSKQGRNHNIQLFKRTKR